MLHLGSLRSDAAQRRTVKADASSVADWARRFEALGATAVDERLRAFYAQGLPAGDTVLADVPLLAMVDVGMSPAATQIQRQSRPTMLQVQAGLAKARPALTTKPAVLSPTWTKATASPD